LTNIGKRPIAVVVVESTSAISGDEKIFMAVVVVVPDRNSCGITDAGNARLLGNIFECAVGLLVVKTVPVLWAVFLRNRILRHGLVNAAAVGEENIQSSVVVVVKKSHPRAHGFQQIFPRGVRCYACEVDTKFLGDINKFAVGSRFWLGW